MVTNLVFVLGLRVEDDVWNKLRENIFEQLKARVLGWDNKVHEDPTDLGGKFKSSPVVPVLHDIQDITFKVNFLVKVRVVENLHRNLPVLVLFLQFLILEVEIVADGFTRKLDLFIHSLSEFGFKSPVSDSDGDTEEDDKEPVGFPAIGQRKETLDDPWAKDNGSRELVVGEGCAALSGKRGVRDGGVGSAVEQLG